MLRGEIASGQNNKKDSGLVAVAIGADKNSQHALRWAADHLVTPGQIFILLHVRKNITAIPTSGGQNLPIEDVDEEVVAGFLKLRDARTRELLLPFQCFCRRRGLQCKEVILNASDLPKAIIQFLMQQSVDNLVLGGSSRNAFTRAFKADVATSVSKIAPDFCSVYVVSKGKILSVRPAPSPNKNPIKTQLSDMMDDVGHSFQSTKSEPVPEMNVEEDIRSPFATNSPLRQVQGVTDSRSFEDMLYGRMDRANQDAGPPLDISYQSAISCPSPSRPNFDQPINYPTVGHLDLSNTQNENSCHDEQHLDSGGRQSKLSNMCNKYSYYDEQIRSYGSNGSGTEYWSNGSGSSGNECSPPVSQYTGKVTWSSNSMEYMEAEMRRLKLQLQQRREMYVNLSREALNKQEARDHRPEVVQVAEQMNDDARRKAMLEAEKTRKPLDSTHAYGCCRRYTLQEIEKATGNFSESLKIGEGGYGPVFKSNLDQRVVAIKILQCDSDQGMKQFQQEMEVLGRIRHPNMVQLLGACPEYGCLVYEYMANGSLEDRLLCRGNTPPLSWQLRFKIAAEIATSLLHLHEHKPEPLVHRDLKPGNILLDDNLVGKIADVGLARLIPASVADTVTQYRMTAAAGTFCYIDPEYQKTGMLGIKSDIYALGIILLQLITGRPPMGIAHNVENAIEMNQLAEWLDPRVADWPMEETLKFAKLSLKCAELQRKDRPDLGTVVLPELNRLRMLAESSLGLSSFQLVHKSGHQEVVGAPSVRTGFKTEVGMRRVQPASVRAGGFAAASFT